MEKFCILIKLWSALSPHPQGSGFEKQNLSIDPRRTSPFFNGGLRNKEEPILSTMDRRWSPFYQGGDLSRKRDVSLVIRMPLYGIEGSKKRDGRWDFSHGTKNNEVNDETKRVRNDRAKKNIEEMKEFDDKRMNG